MKPSAPPTTSDGVTVAGKHFTLMLVPEGVQTKVRRLQIPKKVVWALGLVGLVTLASLSAFGVSYVYVIDEVFEARALRDENARLSARLAELTGKIEEVDTRLADLRKFDEQLRALTDLSDAERGLTMGGLKPASGGANRSDFTAIAVPLEGDDPAVTMLRDALLDSRLAGLGAEAHRQAASLADLVDHFTEREVLLKSTPSIAPARGLLTSGFGSREDPFTGGLAAHSGLDIANVVGTEIIAPADGVVIHSGEKGEYGTCVVIDHGRDTTTLYGHLKDTIVKVGDKVSRGQHIGNMGNTGRSTGSHLHYEVRINGVPVNPRRYVMH
jgi:murein DD-endopeptidase MepM/ murein hydrolase activator NlpD